MLPIHGHNFCHTAQRRHMSGILSRAGPKIRPWNQLYKIKIFDFSKFFSIFSNHLVIVVYGLNFSHLTPSTWPQEQKEDPKKVLSKKGEKISNFSSSAPGPLGAQLWYLWAMLHLMVGPHPIWAKSEICPVLTG